MTQFSWKTSFFRACSGSYLDGFYTTHFNTACKPYVGNYLWDTFLVKDELLQSLEVIRRQYLGVTHFLWERFIE